MTYVIFIVQKLAKQIYDVRNLGHWLPLRGSQSQGEGVSWRRCCFWSSSDVLSFDWWQFHVVRIHRAVHLAKFFFLCAVLQQIFLWTGDQVKLIKA
jgi:energy-coupling factor transporter transmembrane protein EcfT